MRSIFIKITLILGVVCLLCTFSTVQAQPSVITAPDTILVWFVEVDPDNGNPIWKNVDGDDDTDDCNPRGDGVSYNDHVPPICIFIPQNISPNPRPISFETDYLPAVVGGEIEVYSDIPLEAAKAQAVAARSFALYDINYPASYCENSCHVTQSTAHQFYASFKTSPTSRQAVNATHRLYLTSPFISEIAPIFSQFSRDHNGLFTVGDANISYLKSVYDPITDGSEGYSHGKGMSQLGALRWTTGVTPSGDLYPTWDFTKILAHYYTGVRMRHGGTGALYWTGYRWNMLDAYINRDVYTGNQYTDPYMRIQNTGMHDFLSGTQLVYRAKSVSSSGSIDYTPWMTSTATSVPILAPGDDALLSNVTFSVPSWFYKGRAYHSYQIEWDLARSSGVKYHEYGYGWLTQEIPISLRKQPDPVRCKTCPSASSSASSAVVDWYTTNDSDPITYLWERYNNGTRTLTGAVTVSDTAPYGSTSVPLIEGPNTFYIRAVEQADLTNSSPTQPLADIVYDSQASVLTLNSSHVWVQSGGTVNLSFSIDDSALGSGIDSYTLIQKHPNGSTTILDTRSGIPDTLFIPPTTRSTTIQGSHGETTSFELTTTDKVGHQATTTVGVSIDAQAPLLIQSYEPIWTNQATVPVSWVVEDAASGVQQVQVDMRQAGGAWVLCKHGAMLRPIQLK